MRNNPLNPVAAAAMAAASQPSLSSPPQPAQQQVEVPANLPLQLTLTIVEVDMLARALGQVATINQGAALHGRLLAEMQMAVARHMDRAANPPQVPGIEVIESPAPEGAWAGDPTYEGALAEKMMADSKAHAALGAVANGAISGDAAKAVSSNAGRLNFNSGFTPKGPADARELVKALEAARRGGDGTMNVTGDNDPDHDYAVGLTLLGAGMSHIEEALPNGQRERALRAFGLMDYGLQVLGGYLQRRV